MGRIDREERGRGRSFRDRVRQREKERKSFGRKLNIPEGTNFWKKPADAEIKSKLDIIPYMVTQKGLGYAEPGEPWYEKTFLSHWGVGGGGGSVVCPTTIGKPCPVCEHVAELRKQPKSPETDKIIGQLKAKERQLFNVLDLKDLDKGVQLYEEAYYNFGRQLDKELKDPENEEFLAFPDLKEGFTLKVRWASEKQGEGKPYMKADSITFMARETPLKSSLMEKAIDLDAALIIPTYQELVRLFNGAEEEDEDAPKEDKKSSKHGDEDEGEDKDSKKNKKSPSKADEDDEDEDEPEEKEEDDEDEDDPKKNEDEEEDDEDRPPRRSSKHGK